MSVFELLGDANPAVPSLSEPDNTAYQDVLERLRLYFEEHGYPSEAKGLQTVKQRFAVDNIMKPLSFSVELEQHIQSQHRELLDKLSEFKRIGAAQDDVLYASESRVEQLKSAYTQAVVSDEKQEVEQVEADLQQCGQEIQKAKIRKEALMQAKREIKPMLATINAMITWLDKRKRQDALATARQVYLEELQRFSAAFMEYRGAMIGAGRDVVAYPDPDHVELYNEVTRHLYRGVDQ